MGWRLADVAEWAWYDHGAGATLARQALSPLSAVFGAIIERRNAAFDRAPGDASPIPALSVGNLTVGGTGKTPVASWFARQLRAGGARPALVLRGYGDDEWRVHQLLTPDIPVLINHHRVAAIAQAATQGCDCVVLDDAFQHRRAPRTADVVLVSADRWSGAVHLLPSGPFREPLRALRRATAVIVTVKAASAAQVELVCAAIREAAPMAALAVVRLLPDALRQITRDAAPTVRPISSLRGSPVVVMSAIADPAAFEQQLRDHGTQIVFHRRFPDHHAYSRRDVSEVARLLHGAESVVCTLKDAVKLAPLWPREVAPLWYVSQTLVVERGAEVLERECDRVLAAR